MKVYHEKAAPRADSRAARTQDGPAPTEGSSVCWTPQVMIAAHTYTFHEHEPVQFTRGSTAPPCRGSIGPGRRCLRSGRPRRRSAAVVRLLPVGEESSPPQAARQLPIHKFLTRPTRGRCWRSRFCVPSYPRWTTPRLVLASSTFPTSIVSLRCLVGAGAVGPSRVRTMGPIPSRSGRRTAKSGRVSAAVDHEDELA